MEKLNTTSKDLFLATFSVTARLALFQQDVVLFMAYFSRMSAGPSSKVKIRLKSTRDILERWWLANLLAVVLLFTSFHEDSVSKLPSLACFRSLVERVVKFVNFLKSSCPRSTSTTKTEPGIIMMIYLSI